MDVFLILKKEYSTTMCEIMRDFIKEIYRILNIKEAYELPAALLSFVRW